MYFVCEYNCATACVKHTGMHISKARQLLGLLNFCLLSRAESEIERIDLLSTGGVLPWAAHLFTLLAAMQRALFLTTTPPALTLPAPHSLSLQGGCLSSSWHLSCCYWERCVLRCWHLLFLASSRSGSRSLWKRQRIGVEMVVRGCWGAGWKEEGEYCQLSSPLQTNNFWYNEGIKNTKLTVLLVVEEGSFVQL